MHGVVAGCCMVVVDGIQAIRAKQIHIGSTRQAQITTRLVEMVIPEQFLLRQEGRG